MEGAIHPALPLVFCAWYRQYREKWHRSPNSELISSELSLFKWEEGIASVGEFAVMARTWIAYQRSHALPRRNLDQQYRQPKYYRVVWSFQDNQVPSQLTHLQPTPTTCNLSWIFGTHQSQKLGLINELRRMPLRVAYRTSSTSGAVTPSFALKMCDTPSLHWSGYKHLHLYLDHRTLRLVDLAWNHLSSTDF